MKFIDDIAHIGSTFSIVNLMRAYFIDSASPELTMKHVDCPKVVYKTLALVTQLCQTLKMEGINYCHWKSNVALDRSACGKNDLDLLVSRADVQRFTEILYRLGFKEARPDPERELPGILHYYGYDGQADMFVHVHAHYQLIVGDDATKNYRLPCEKAFLASAVQGDLFRVPSPEFELILLVVRMMLKHSAWDSMLSFHRNLSDKEKLELAYLRERVDLDLMQGALKQYLPFLDRTLFDRCLQTLLKPGRSLGMRYLAGRRLHYQLQAHGRCSDIVDTGLKLWRRFFWGIKRYLFKQPSRKYLIQGGAIIALVGGDGSGKSTSVNELSTWLAKKFVTKRIHFGKPRWSLLSFVIKGLLRVGRRLGLFSNRKFSPQSPISHDSSELPSYSWMLWHVLTARDRYRAYIRARRMATNGGLVICDRFPLPQIKYMDGAQTGRMINKEKAPVLVRFLNQLEDNYYQNIMSPDVLIVLRVDPEIAVQRRADEEASWIRNRSREIWNVDWTKTSAYVIDSGLPKAEMLASLKSMVWKAL
jgi:thymidylate kinase